MGVGAVNAPSRHHMLLSNKNNLFDINGLPLYVVQLGFIYLFPQIL